MPKVKISISLDPSVLDAVDESAAIGNESRTAVIEKWLRDASRRAKSTRLDAETAAYYESLSLSEQEENAAWATASSRASRRLVIDDRQLNRTGRASRRRRG
jgi:metal-responsive CopG/Arc/MetJ family transcriptional regulator